MRKAKAILYIGDVSSRRVGDFEIEGRKSEGACSEPAQKSQQKNSSKVRWCCETEGDAGADWRRGKFVVEQIDWPRAERQAAGSCLGPYAGMARRRGTWHAEHTTVWRVRSDDALLPAELNCFFSASS
jgi:hypothetical protein